MRQIPGKLLVIWDGSPIHRGRAVKDFLASGASPRLQLEQLPGYAPDLNPDEGVWKHLKCVELKNLCCQSLAEVEDRAAQSQGAPEKQKRCHPRLHQTAGVRGLDVRAEISSLGEGWSGWQFVGGCRELLFTLCRFLTWRQSLNRCAKLRDFPNSRAASRLSCVAPRQ